MPKILHIQKVAGIAGSENHLLTLLPQLKEYGYAPTMLVLADSEDRPGSFIEQMQAAGIRTHLISILGDLDPLLLPRLVHFIRQQNYYFVHTHLLHADLYGTLAARMAGVKFVISTRHNDDTFRKLYPIRQCLAWVNRYVDRVICISDHVRKFSTKVEATPKEKITVIHYGLNPNLGTDDPSWRQQLGWGSDVSVLGIVARLTEQKGHITLLNAIPEVLHQFPQTRLVVVGDGELRAQLDQAAVKLGISGNIHFLGYQQNAAAMMTGFDIFVHPSRWEGFGLVFLEAMAARLPIVATQVSAIPEIVRHGETGLLVPVDDVPALSRAISTLLADRLLAQRMGQSGYCQLEKNFTVSVMLARTCGVYQSLLLHNSNQN